MLQVNRPGLEFEQFACEVRLQFLSGYSPSDPAPDGSFRPIQVEARDTIPQCARGRAITIKAQTPPNQLNLRR